MFEIQSVRYSFIEKFREHIVENEFYNTDDTIIDDELF